MKTLRIILVVTFTIIAILAAAFFLATYFKPKPAGIRIDTTPTASIYLNGAFVGKTPYRGTFAPGQVTLKLVPGNEAADLFPYETKITLTSGIETVVRREFGSSEDTSSGDVLSFEKGDSTSLIVVSTPDNAQVSIDGVPRGFAPYKTSAISPAEHQISVKAPGYTDRVMTLNTISGYQLTVFAKLGKSGEGQADQLNPSPTPAPRVDVFVEILQTPTGFLRVRTQPGTAGEEIAEVKPGTQYKYLETDGSTGWFKIQYEDAKPGLPNGITGWVSNQFTKLVDQNGKVATPSATQI